MAKIEVEIIRADGTRKTKSCKTTGNKVIVQKETKRKAEKKAEYNNECVTYGGFFHKPKVYLCQDADKCIPVLRKPGKDQIPVWDADSEQNLFGANVIKASGATTSKIEIPMKLWLLMVASLFITVLTFLVSSGRMRI